MVAAGAALKILKTWGAVAALASATVTLSVKVAATGELKHGLDETKASVAEQQKRVDEHSDAISALREITRALQDGQRQQNEGQRWTNDRLWELARSRGLDVPLPPHRASP